jgi:hypothetical protein
MYWCDALYFPFRDAGRFFHNKSEESCYRWCEHNSALLEESWAESIS